MFGWEIEIQIYWMRPSRSVAGTLIPTLRKPPVSPCCAAYESRCQRLPARMTLIFNFDCWFFIFSLPVSFLNFERVAADGLVVFVSSSQSCWIAGNGSELRRGSDRPNGHRLARPCVVGRMLKRRFPRFFGV